MNKKKKIAAVITSVALIAAIGIGSTFAFLTQKTGTLTNTFTVGAGIGITLDEANYAGMDGYDTTTKHYTAGATELPASELRTSTGNRYSNVIGGTSLTKDPTVTITKGSTPCYVFIHVQGVDALESLNDNATDPEYYFTVGDFSNKWQLVQLDDPSNTSNSDGYYVYVGDSTTAQIVTPTATADTKLDAIFSTVSFSDNVSDVLPAVLTNDMNKIRITACAVQSAAVTPATAFNACADEFLHPAD